MATYIKPGMWITTNKEEKKGFFNIDNLILKLAGNKLNSPEVFSVTKSQLNNLIDTNSLKPFSFYIIEDYQTIQKPIGLNPVSIEPYHYADVEPILIQAITNNKLAKKGISLIYPDEYVYYNQDFLILNPDNDIEELEYYQNDRDGNVTLEFLSNNSFKIHSDNPLFSVDSMSKVMQFYVYIANNDIEVEATTEESLYTYDFENQIITFPNNNNLDLLNVSSFYFEMTAKQAVNEEAPKGLIVARENEKRKLYVDADYRGLLFARYKANVPNFDIATNYVKGNVVRYNNSIWVAVKNTIGENPTTVKSTTIIKNAWIQVGYDHFIFGYTSFDTYHIPLGTESSTEYELRPMFLYSLDDDDSVLNVLIKRAYSFEFQFEIINFTYDNEINSDYFRNNDISLSGFLSVITLFYDNTIKTVHNVTAINLYENNIQRFESTIIRSGLYKVNAKHIVNSVISGLNVYDCTFETFINNYVGNLIFKENYVNQIVECVFENGSGFYENIGVKLDNVTIQQNSFYINQFQRIRNTVFQKETKNSKFSRVDNCNFYGAINSCILNLVDTSNFKNITTSSLISIENSTFNGSIVDSKIEHAYANNLQNASSAITRCNFTYFRNNYDTATQRLELINVNSNNFRNNTVHSTSAGYVSIKYCNLNHFENNIFTVAASANITLQYVNADFFKANNLTTISNPLIIENVKIGHFENSAITNVQNIKNVFFNQKVLQLTIANINNIINAVFNKEYNVYTLPERDYLNEIDNVMLLPNIKRGADQASAGAIAGEMWATLGHASLPDNSILIGV